MHAVVRKEMLLFATVMIDQRNSEMDISRTHRARSVKFRKADAKNAERPFSPERRKFA